MGDINRGLILNETYVDLLKNTDDNYNDITFTKNLTRYNILINIKKRTDEENEELENLQNYFNEGSDSSANSAIYNEFYDLYSKVKKITNQNSLYMNDVISQFIDLAENIDTAEKFRKNLEYITGLILTTKGNTQNYKSPSKTDDKNIAKKQLSPTDIDNKDYIVKKIKEINDERERAEKEKKAKEEQRIIEKEKKQTAKKEEEDKRITDNKELQKELIKKRVEEEKEKPSNKTADNKPADNKPADNKTADNKPADNTTSNSTSISNPVISSELTTTTAPIDKKSKEYIDSIERITKKLSDLIPDIEYIEKKCTFEKKDNISKDLTTDRNITVPYSKYKDKIKIYKNEYNENLLKINPKFKTSEEYKKANNDYETTINDVNSLINKIGICLGIEKSNDILEYENFLINIPLMFGGNNIDENQNIEYYNIINSDIKNILLIDKNIRIIIDNNIKNINNIISNIKQITEIDLITKDKDKLSINFKEIGKYLDEKKITDARNITTLENYVSLSSITEKISLIQKEASLFKINLGKQKQGGANNEKEEEPLITLSTKLDNIFKNIFERDNYEYNDLINVIKKKYDNDIEKNKENIYEILFIIINKYKSFIKQYESDLELWYNNYNEFKKQKEKKLDNENNIQQKVIQAQGYNKQDKNIDTKIGGNTSEDTIYNNIKKEIDFKYEDYKKIIDNCINLLKQVRTRTNTYSSSLNKTVVNDFIHKDGTNIFTDILNSYNTESKSKDALRQEINNNFFKKIQVNNLDPETQLELTFTDKVVFLFITFLIRYIVLSILQYFIDNNQIRDIIKGLYYYTILYITFIIIIIIIVNLDTYKLRIVLNYFNVHINLSRLYTHIIIICIFTFIIYLLMKNINIEKNTPIFLSESEKIKLSYRIDILTMIIFIFMSILILII